MSEVEEFTFPATADPNVVKSIVDFVKDPDPNKGVVFNREERLARRANRPVEDAEFNMDKDPLAATTTFNREQHDAAGTPIYDEVKEEFGVEVEEENDGDIPDTGEEVDVDGSDLDDADDEDQEWSEDDDEDEDVEEDEDEDEGEDTTYGE